MKRVENIFEGIEFLQSQEDFEVSNCNMSELKAYSRNFRKDIVEGQKNFRILGKDINNERFKIEPRECGLGKTHDVLTALIDKYTHLEAKGSIYVAKTKRSGNELVEQINRIFEEDIAFAINEDTIKDRRNMLNKLKIYPIIAITQSLYKIIASNKKMINKFQEGRDLLILDEWFSLADIKSISLDDIKAMEYKLADINIIAKFKEIVEELETYLSTVDNKRHFFNVKTQGKTIRRKINKLKILITENISDDFLERYGTNTKQLIHQIEDIYHFFNGTCLVENYVLYTVNRELEYWKLSNNFILDASAKLNGAYSLNPRLFCINKYNSVLDYKNWNLIRINENSTISGKDNYSNYYDVVRKIANDLGVNDTLIVDNMESANKNYLGLKATYFANLRSNNDYKNMKNVIIACTPYLPDREVVLEYLYHSNKTFNEENVDIFDNVSWYGGKHGLIYELNNDDFEEYRKQLVESEIYQAIKRVNRDMSQDTTVVFITRDDSVFYSIEEMLPNCNVIQNSKYNSCDSNEFLFKRKAKKRPFESETSNVSEVNESYANKAINLFKEIINGKVPKELKTQNKDGTIIEGKLKKSAIGQYIGIDYSKKNASSIFCNKVLNKIEVIDFMRLHHIEAKGQYLFF